MPDPLPVMIRACLPGDISAITAIYEHAVIHGTASFEVDAPDAAEMTRRWEHLLEGGYPYLVAESQHELLGYAYAGPYRSRPAYAHTVEDSVYIRQDCQHRGIGLALLRRLVEEARLGGYRQMIAVIGDSGNQASIRLHERAGFVHAGTLRAVGWKHGRWLDVVHMQRVLEPGASTAASPLKRST
jgi:L-amino acid N-acyltransferase YncA